MYLNDDAPFFVPVLSYNEEKGQVRQVYGTAFKLLQNTFMTTGHSVEAAQSERPFGIGTPLEVRGRVWIMPATAAEIIPEYDLGLIRVDEPDDSRINALPWTMTAIGGGDYVMSGGYAMGLDLAEHTLTCRSFRGNVVADLYKVTLLAGNPVYYELSFAAPVGLSGAPVMDINRNVVGYIIGNRQSGMETIVSREVSSDGAKEETFTRWEGISYGLAVSCHSLKDVKSELLGMSIGEFIQSRPAEPNLRGGRPSTDA
jgi:hypothetical protein